ncbi:hypothetical protein [Heliorestis convoluta]|uniref:ParB/Sulfiredoxin domain-containing protein n=1 Tax=Heliorestis convoluta TaxID=356322 RepID=A0A5Q2MZG2_9FIRM|nr:hypothetical protein [Heliorestis convoluta]QGG46322.1 hypothetical protein FTV88_0143 [Heliorestis convoluta]
MSYKPRKISIRSEKNKYYCNLYHQNLYSIKVYFQEKQLTLMDLDTYYMEQINNKFDGKIGHKIEVLPSVYYIKTAFLNKNTSRRNYDSKLKTLLNVIYNHLYSRQIFNITVDVKNIRDRFEMVDSSEVFEENGYYTDRKYRTENKFLDPKYLPYPDTLGKGPGRCVIWSIFSVLGLLDHGHEVYSIFSHRKMFEVTSYSDRLLNACLNSQHCGEIIKKMQKGKYKAKFETKDENFDDDIQVSYENGRYMLSEGKHRVCMAKRFNINSIPVEVTITTVDEESYVKSNLLIPQRFYKKFINCENILTECYDRYKKLGLDREDVRTLNETASNSNYVDYLEKITNKNILLLAKEQRKKKMINF